MEPLKKNDKTCILLQTHHLDDIYIKEFYRIYDECKDSFDVYILYDNSNDDFSEKKIKCDARYHLFDIDDLATRYNLNRFGRKSWSVTPGNVIFCLLDFARKYEYAFYWLIEYDVRYTGNWESFFRYFASTSSSDLLGTSITTFKEVEDWNWWKTLKTPRFRFIRSSSKIKGFFPVMRLSLEATKAVAKANRKGWKGHYEAVVPTVVKNVGLTVEDVGGDGHFVAAENHNRFYFNNRFTWHFSPGTFVCPPSKPTTEIIDNKLYHKVIG